MSTHDARRESTQCTLWTLAEPSDNRKIEIFLTKEETVCGTKEGLHPTYTGMCTYKWGGAIKIGVRPCWGRGVFVLVLE